MNIKVIARYNRTTLLSRKQTLRNRAYVMKFW